MWTCPQVHTAHDRVHDHGHAAGDEDDFRPALARAPGRPEGNLQLSAETPSELPTRVLLNEPAARGGSLLEVKNLVTVFPTRRGVAVAANHVSFSIAPGETLGLVGESGSGKSVTCRSILRLVPEPGQIIGGSINFDGQDVLSLSRRELRALRGVPDLDDLPGPDVEPQPGLHDRGPDHRAAPPASGDEPAGGAAGGGRAARPRRHPVGARAPAMPTPTSSREGCGSGR